MNEIGRAGSEASSFVTRRPVATLMVFLSVVVFGALSYGRLPLTLMPELTYPTLTIRTEYPGAAPEEVENDVSRPIEEEVGVINGLQKLSSISRAGVSDVVLEFDWATDMSEATQGVLEKLDLVFLPEEAERPLILHFDPSLDPMMELSLSGDGEEYQGEEGLRRLRRLAELQVKRRLEPIAGVAAVRVRGGLEEEIHVLIEEEQLRRTGLSIQQVINRLSQENINVAGGTIKEGRTEYLVRTLNEYENIDEIADTIVATIGGREVRIADIGRVEWSHKEREILTRTDGGESVQIEIYKEGDANIVGLARNVKAALGRAPEALSEAKGGEASEGGAEDDAKAVAAAGPGRGGGGGGLAADLYKQEGARLQVVADRSLFIESSIREVRNTAIIGGLLAILVLFVFLRHLKPTAIIGFSIPISLLITFAPLNLAGVTLNIMSLGGLALGIGMLVDSSIVVLESISRCREEGDGVVPAAVRGTAEVRGAVFASTLTSIAVFLPMVFVEGIAGQAFNDLGLAVVFSLLAAMLVALFFIPMLASRQGMKLTEVASMRRNWLRFNMWFHFTGTIRGIKRRVAWLLLPYWIVRLALGLLIEAIGKLVLFVFALLVGLVYYVLRPVLGGLFRVVTYLPVRFAGWTLDKLNRVYPSVLRLSLRNAWVVVLIFAACVWGSWEMARGLDSELLPEVHQGEFTVEVALPVGTPIEESDAVLSAVEQEILKDRRQIETLILTVGYDPANSKRSDEGEHTAQFRVLLASAGDPEMEQQVIARLRKSFGAIPDLEARVTRPVLFSSKTPVEVEVIGDDLVALKTQARRVAEVMAEMPQLADVDTTLRAGAPEVQIVYDRDRLTRYGLNIQQVATLVRDKVKGFEATRFNLKDRRIPILVRLETNDRESVGDVANLVVNPGGERPIPLRSVATVEMGEGPSEVRRIDGRRTALVRANLAQGSLSAAAAAIEYELNREVEWPAGTTFLVTGQNEEWQRSQGSLVLALMLSVFLVYVIMAAQFESFVQPFIIMLTIPLAFVGTFLLLIALGMSLSIVVFLGMIMLAGIVVNNAIVLVDYINRLRARGLELTEAVITGGSVRLRPILMTTATTVLGLLPMALGFGDGAEIRTPMAAAVIGGLLTSTALTLIVIPTFYTLVARIAERLAGRRGLERREVPGSVAGADPDTVTP